MVGFGCNVAAIYATRTLEDEEDRKRTGFLIVFMSCGARLPVYVVFAPHFWPAVGNLIFAMYLLGIAVALVTGLAMKRFVYKNKPPKPFILELPALPYAQRSQRVFTGQTAHDGLLRNAATIILACSVVIWFFAGAPCGHGQRRINNVRTEDSLFGSLSRIIAPVFAPAGFGSWEAAGR